MKEKILIVDDEEALTLFLARLLSAESPDYEIRTAYTGEDAIKMIEGFHPDCILQDIKLPDISGIEVLKAAKAFDEDIQVIMMTAFASLDTSIEAIKMGAYDYILKPFKAEQIKIAVKNALIKRKLLKENKKLLEELKNANQELKIAYKKLEMAKEEVDKELAEKLKILSELHKITNSLNEELDFEKLCIGILKGAKEIFGVEDAAILLKDEEHPDILFLKHFIGFEKYFEPEFKFDFSHPFFKKLEEEKEPKILNYPEGEIKEVCIGLLRTRNKEPFGVFMIGTKKEDFSFSKIIDIFDIYLNTVSIALCNSMLFEKIEKSYVESLLSLVKAQEAKDRSIKGHSSRVAKLVHLLGKKLNLGEKELRILRYAALLHDIGKIGIREYILEKPFELDKEEYEKMKEHINIGIEILKPLKFLKDAIPIIKHHHENYDGTGYPDELKGNEIPIGARILSICDVYDSITNERIYSNKLTKEEAIEFLKKYSGKKFDPEILDKFIEVIKHEGE